MAGIASTSALQLQSINMAEQSEDEEFIYFKATMRLPIAPIWGATGIRGELNGSGGMDGVREILAGWLMRYLPPLQSVLLTFGPTPTLPTSTSSFPLSHSPFPKPSKSASNILDSDDSESDDEDDEMIGDDEPVQKMMKFKGIPIIAGSGFGLAQVEWQGLGWRPRLGQKLSGTPTLSTPSHISLLLHNLFNASIPVTHIPEDIYYFDSDYPVPSKIQERRELNFPIMPITIKKEGIVVPTDDDIATEAVVEGEGEQYNEEEVEEEVEQNEIEQEEDLYRQRGWWRNKITQEPLGGEEGVIQFTVVGITIANSTISLTGSLLSKPFETPLIHKENLQTKRARSFSVSSDSEKEEDEEEERVVEPPVLLNVKKVKEKKVKVDGKEKVKKVKK